MGPESIVTKQGEPSPQPNRLGGFGRWLLLFCLAGLPFALLPEQALAATSNITAVWANDGGDKVTQDELRATNHTENLTGTVINHTWNGSGIHLFGAHNEEVSFNLILEAARATATNVSISFDTLTGPGGATIHSVAASGNSVFTYVDRPIELFFTRYLQIKGLSYFGYPSWEERMVPIRLQRPHDSQGNPIDSLGWYGRPDHDKYYPDILVPIELTRTFGIPAGTNQAIWSDIYIPKAIPAGTYTGSVSVLENGIPTKSIHVALDVAPFTLPDEQPRWFGHISDKDVAQRFVSQSYVNWASSEGRRIQAITDRYFQLFHRHRMALIGENECPIEDHPCDSSIPRLDGSLYTRARGYDGAGYGVPNGVFSIGTYGTWSWGDSGEQNMWNHADNWVSWFKRNLPSTDFFLYLQDEPPMKDYGKVDDWARWLKEDPGPGHELTSFATVAPVVAQTFLPHVDIPIMPISIGLCLELPCDNVALNTQVNDSYRNNGKKRLWAYNDGRPASGSMTTEDDGVAPRALGWSQFKMDIGKWYYWFVNLDQPTDLFQQAVTWDSVTHFDWSKGEQGNSTTNGNGIMVYPGTDLFNPQSSYNVDGPFASIRMKAWRRGLQDYDYLDLAKRIDPQGTAAIVQRVLPRTMWEISAPDPTYYRGGIFFEDDPDVWEQGRADLLQIISNYCTSSGQGDSLCDGTIPAVTPRTQIEFTSQTNGARVKLTGSNCQSGTYVVPYALTLPVAATCTIEALGPSGYSFLVWGDSSSTINPRVITVGALSAHYDAQFATSLPTAPTSPRTVTAAPVGLHFVPITPCRVADTRNSTGAFGGPALSAGITREFLVPASDCNIPVNAAAYAFNATVVPLANGLRWLTVWPSDQQQPFVSTLNSYDGRTKANGLIVRAAANGGIKVFASEQTHFILDINGYFLDDVTAMTYHPVVPCRVLDTRLEQGPLGGPFVARQTERKFPITMSSCGLSATAQAYSLNYTVIPRNGGPLGWMTAWPTGTGKPLASIINAVTGTVTANNAITQAGVSGAISVFGSDDFDLLVDVNGYFDSPAQSGGLVFYPVDACRLFDTREPPYRAPLKGLARFTAANSCQVPNTASVLAANLTVIPQGSLAWLTAWPDGAMPLASSLNAYDGQVTSNSALTPLSNGAFQMYGTQATDVVVDVAGFFAP